MSTHYGNTPTGIYTGYLYGPVDNTGSYGPYQVIYTDAVSGIVFTSGRSGIWIHGGTASSTTATTAPLRPTNGCVRISNTNQGSLQNQIATLTNATGYHDSTGDVVISQYNS
jgi:hypothetical protein